MSHCVHSEEVRPNAFAQFIRFRERNRTLQLIMDDDPSFDITTFIDLDDDVPIDGDGDGDDIGLVQSNFVRFRECNVVELAFKLAANERLFALQSLFRYHWHDIAQRDRLCILSWIPPTVHPLVVRELLPSMKAPRWTTDRWFADELGLKREGEEDQVERP